LTSFSYPVRMITRKIYCSLTERPRSFKSEEWVELIFFLATFTWIAHVFAYFIW
jgi:hypothetical protein